MDCKYITRVILGNKVFIGALLLFVLNEVVGREVRIVFLDSYFNDFIAPIIFLTLTNFVMSIYSKTRYVFSYKQLIFFFLYLSIFFEYLLPKTSNSYVADFNDLLAYASGILLYHFLINKK